MFQGRKGLTVLIIAGTAVIAILSLKLFRNAPPSHAAAARPDMTGVWDRPGADKEGVAYGGTRPVGGKWLSGWIKWDDPVMTPWALEIFKKNRKGTTNPFEDGITELDPSQWCYPVGPSRAFTNTQPFEIIQQENRVTVLYEKDHTVRTVFTDGRGHPPDMPFTWMGHTTGKWEGDTLVADTVKIRPETWINHIGYPKSEQMHMVERFHMVDKNTLQIDTTFDDPKAYEKPWTEKKTYKLMPPGYEILERVECEEWMEIGKPRHPGKYDKYYELE